MTDDLPESDFFQKIKSHLGEEHERRLHLTYSIWASNTRRFRGQPELHTLRSASSVEDLIASVRFTSRLMKAAHRALNGGERRSYVPVAIFATLRGMPEDQFREIWVKPLQATKAHLESLRESGAV
ncbi:MAG: hypothetical protein AABX01_02965 [Candidatus Micrarchaeota archaeon]